MIKEAHELYIELIEDGLDIELVEYIELGTYDVVVIISDFFYAKYMAKKRQMESKRDSWGGVEYIRNYDNITLTIR